MKLDQLLEAPKPKMDPKLKDEIIEKLKDEWATSGRHSSVSLLYNLNNPGVEIRSSLFHTQNFKKSCFEFLADGTIGIKDHVALDTLPVKCSYIKANTFVNEVEGWKNFPSSIDANFYLNANSIDNFQGAPKFNGSLYMSTPYKTLTDDKLSGLTHVNGDLGIDMFKGDIDVFKHITINGVLAINSILDSNGKRNFQILPLMLTPGITKAIRVLRARAKWKPNLGTEQR